MPLRGPGSDFPSDNPRPAHTSREIDGCTYETDEVGHLMARRDGELHKLDPYGHLAWSFSYDVEDASGTVDYLECLDYVVLGAHVAFLGVRDSDSAGFTEHSVDEVAPRERAPEESRQIAVAAIDRVMAHYADNVDEVTLSSSYDHRRPDAGHFRRVAEDFATSVLKDLARTPVD